VGRTLGISDSGVWAARWGGDCRMFVQRSGHGGPPPRDPGAGPLRRGFSVAGTLGLLIQVLGLPVGARVCGGCPAERTQRSAPPSRGWD